MSQNPVAVLREIGENMRANGFVMERMPLNDATMRAFIAQQDAAIARIADLLAAHIDACDTHVAGLVAERFSTEERR